MARTKYTPQQFAEWHAWYLSHPGTSYRDVANRFSVPLNTVKFAFAQQRLMARAAGAQPEPGSVHIQTRAVGVVDGGDYAVDPFGAAAADIRTAVGKALANDGAMSEAEYQILQTIKGLVA